VSPEDLREILHAERLTVDLEHDLVRRPIYASSPPIDPGSERHTYSGATTRSIRRCASSASTTTRGEGETLVEKRAEGLREGQPFEVRGFGVEWA
jgi:hypothetical protein